MPWGELSQQAAVARLLENSSLAGRVAHAYLFVGPDNSGKETAARLLAQALNCQTGRPCGVCSSCRLIVAGSHPDVQTIKPTGRFLRLDQIRELCRRAGNTSFLGPVKVFLIWQADALLPEAANHLLKMLEEPPAGTVFILTAPDRETVLPTIVSRCQLIKFKPLSAAAIRQQLAEAGASGEWLNLAAALAEGDPAAAADLADEEFGGLVEQFLALTGELPLGQGAVFRIAQTFATAPDKYLLLLEAWYRDLLALKAGAGEMLYFQGREQPLGQAASAYSLAQLIGCNRAIEETKQLIFGRTNANVRLALEALLVDLVPGG